MTSRPGKNWTPPIEKRFPRAAGDSRESSSRRPRPLLVPVQRVPLINRRRVMTVENVAGRFRASRSFSDEKLRPLR